MEYLVDTIYGQQALDRMEKSLNVRAAEGWRLHSWNYIGNSFSGVTFVMEKDQWPNAELQQAGSGSKGS